MFGLSRDLGIDLGTSNLLIFQKGRGIVVREPSVVATAKLTGEPKAFGEEARAMIGRTPMSIEIVHPIQGGAIASYTATEAMLKHYFARIQGKTTFFKPRVLVSVPSNVTSVEKQAVLDACRAAGAKDAYPIEEPMAAALGLGLGVGEPEGNLVLDIGGGTSDIAVISLGGIVISESVRVGGEALDEAIHRYIKREYNILLGERSAEEIKWAVGSAYPLGHELETEVRGRDMIDGMPKTIRIGSPEIRQAIAESLGQILDKLRFVLERTPPELTNDIAQSGIWLSGGGALLRGLEDRITHETGIPTHRSDDPLSCVINGAGCALDQIETLAQTHFSFVGER